VIPLLKTLRTRKLAKPLAELFKLPEWASGWPVLKPLGLNKAVQHDLQSLCPSNAFKETETEFQLDLAHCVLCGRCIEALPNAIGEMRTLEVAVTRRDDLVQRVNLETGDFIEVGAPEPARRELHLPTLALRVVSAGDTGLNDAEIALAGNPFNDMGRFGFSLVASPRHADALLITGPVSLNMREALERTYHAAPEPKGVMAVGNEAIAGEVFAHSSEVVGGVDHLLPVDVYVPGSPAKPASILHGLLLMVGKASQGLIGGKI
jgi:Ni,Fe-hydrogenase III small subunit